MSMVKRLLISAVSATFVVVALIAVLVLFPSPTLSHAFLAVGLPVGALLAVAAPHSLVYALAPEGGANAAAILFTVSALLTWFLILFMLSFIVIGRMRSSNTVERDARKSGAPSP
jgi:hypothetical protein